MLDQLEFLHLVVLHFVTSLFFLLIKGSTDGDVYIWDTTLPPRDSVLSPVYKFRAHDDCVNGIRLVSAHSKQFFIILCTKNSY